MINNMANINQEKDPLEVIGRARGYCRTEIIKNLKRHANFTPNLLQQIKEIPNVILRNMGSSQARKINKMMKEVFTEVYRAKQFTRTEINSYGVLYGIVSLKHDVLDLVLNYFHERWSDCVICLYNEITYKTGVIDEIGKIVRISLPLEKVVEKFSKDRKFVPYFDDIQFSGIEIFETLYNSQHVNERENIKYFRRMIPKSCYSLPGMKGGVEKQFKNKKINDFF